MNQKLRKKKIDLTTIQKPPIVKLELLNNFNPLINLVLVCLSNIKSLLL